MAEQIGLSLPVQSSEGIDEFYISACNTMAVNLLEDWKNWPNLKHILSGPPAFGKTHLGRIWAKQVSATYTDARSLKVNNIDKIARNSLNSAGLNYRHGTGHGVGAFLNVHEGPQGISKNNYVQLK